jgi:hypothetical protein
MKYTVSLWGSKPGTNDDCHTGANYNTKAEALRVYAQPEQYFSPVSWRSTVWVEIDGSDIHEERRVVTVEQERAMCRRDAADDRAWQREIATQAGMAFGVDAYNEEMGYGSVMDAEEAVDSDAISCLETGD